MANAKGGDSIVRMNARMEALNPLLPDEAPDDRELDARLAALLGQGFEEVAGSVVLADFAETACRTTIADFGDETGFEAFVNHVHIEDELPGATPSETLAAQAVLFARCLARDLSDAYPGEAFEVVLSVGDSYTVRFYKSRPGQGWLADDLDGYEEEAVLQLLVFPGR